MSIIRFQTLCFVLNDQNHLFEETIRIVELLTCVIF